MSETGKGVKELFEEVIHRGLCTGCGACITGCPYLVDHEGKIVLMDKCTGSDGDCYKHCPRTFFDRDAVGRAVFGDAYADGEIGPYLEIFMARSMNPEIREKGQDGGTVTGLLALALEEGLIDVAACTWMNEDKMPRGYLARSRLELLRCAGSSYEASLALAACRSLPREGVEKIAIVGRGCQMEAVGKMKQLPPQNGPDPGHIRLTVGLICGWALSPVAFHPYLKGVCELLDVRKFDIPHTPHYSFDVHFHKRPDPLSLPLDEIKPFINPACGYCGDMTAEFSDVSIGSAGSAFPGWNTVIVRTPTASELLGLANRKGALETRPLPDDRLENLKKAARKRKSAANESMKHLLDAGRQ